MSKTVEIDVVSDVMCPWCLVGSARLDQALAAFPEVRARVTYHPFLLDPSIPPEGQDLRERLQRKYGLDPASMFVRVEQAARDSGVPLDFSKVSRVVSTVAAHTLARHAAGRGTQRALVRALFDAYFLEGRDVSDPAVLASLASRHGFSEDDARRLATDEDELEATRIEAAGMAAQGITGVPFFVFDGAVAVNGAQSVETLKGVLTSLLGDGPRP